jgi:FlaA1/EpsC-like NDP-sugar epimerase
LMEAIKRINNANNKVYNIWLRPWEKIHELMINRMEGQRIISFQNMYIIKSTIQEYKFKDKNIEYMNKWKEIKIWEYSSETECVSVNEIINLFSNYLKITSLKLGLLVNFGRKSLESKRIANI